MAFDNQRKTGQTVLYKQGDLNQAAAAITDNLPHIRSVKSGINKWDPVHRSIFELSFTLPPLLQGDYFMEVCPILSQQVVSVSGLDALQKTTAAGEQKFYGVTVSYLNPTLDSTAAELTVNFNLNLRNVTDNFVLKLFKAWANISYDLADGTRSIKSDYCAASMMVAEANRNGDVWRSYEFKDVMLTGISGLDSLDYTQNEAAQLACTFRSDYWYDTFADGAING